MFKMRYVAIVIPLFLISCGFHGKGIPGKAGNWRVHVGPAGNEFHAPPPEKKKIREDIMVEVKALLGPYRAKFNFENQIEKVGKRPARPDGGYRFVVLGDSRSNRDLWFSMVSHIDQLDPKPVFVINTGDIVRHGYTKEYLEYYLPPLLETDIPYFVAIGNHDYGTDGDALEFRYLFGENALNYFFDYGKARYVFMDNVTNVNSHKETLEWLDTVLKETPEGFRRIVAVHQPVATIKKWAYHSWDKGYSQLFGELMEKYIVDHVFFGHIHAYSTMTLNGIPYTISGGGGAGLHHRFGPLGNVHHYVICDVMADGSMEQSVVRFYRDDS
jgi:3',5'-cyclic AMP phosphodiesterase CpdA